MEKRWNASADHAWMLQAAYDEPLPLAEGSDLPSIAALWGRARAFFARILTQTGPLNAYARLARVWPPERRKLLNWLVPVETMVRCLLMARAVAWLATPEGRKLFAKTPKIALAARFGSVQKQGAQKAVAQNHVESVPYPGWRTIAAHNRPLKQTPEPEHKPVSPDRDELANNRRPFRLARWKATEGGEGAAPSIAKPTAAPRKLILTFEDLERETDTPAPGSYPLDRRHSPQGLALAARIDALARVLENPERAIRRFARILASFDVETIACVEAPLVPDRVWFQGTHESRQSTRHAFRSMGGLRRLLEPG